MFREECERMRWNANLDKAMAQLYLAALAFYRTKRGKGNTAVDVSHSFYRANLMQGFENYWQSAANSRRAEFTTRLNMFVSDLAAIQ